MRPKKPDRPLRAVVVAKNAAWPQVEHLPRVQEDLELAVGRKFVGAMADFLGIPDGLSVGHGEGDLIAKSPDGRLVTIQVVEMVDNLRRPQGEMRASYFPAVKAVAGLAVFVRGCEVTLVDSASEPILPRLRSQAGRECLEQMVGALKAAGQDALLLPPGRSWFGRVAIGMEGFRLDVVVKRVAPSDAGVHATLEWSGGAASRENLLTKTIQGKLAMHYSRPEAAILVARVLDRGSIA